MSETWFGIPRESIEWFPKIDYDKCIGCMACLNKCTHGVYAEVDGKPEVVNKNNCVVGCTGCQKVCQNNAISHPPKEYLQRLSKNKDFKIGCNCGGK
jgi:NAD-dependent dihydropyrimidine dehydrogenase PreA subunit